MQTRVRNSAGGQMDKSSTAAPSAAADRRSGSRAARRIMMLKVLLLFVLLLAGIVVGPRIAGGHRGYVLIQTDNYNIETSVTGLAIILIVAKWWCYSPLSGYYAVCCTGAHTRGWFAGRNAVAPARC